MRELLQLAIHCGSMYYFRNVYIVFIHQYQHWCQHLDVYSDSTIGQWRAFQTCECGACPGILKDKRICTEIHFYCCFFNLKNIICVPPSNYFLLSNGNKCSCTAWFQCKSSLYAAWMLMLFNHVTHHNITRPPSHTAKLHISLDTIVSCSTTQHINHLPN